MRTVLHYMPGKCSLAVHILLRELGLDFELVEVKESDAPAAHAGVPIRSEGLVPVLRRGPVVMRETLAILLFLAQEHRHLRRPVNQPPTADEWMWLVYLSNRAHPAVARYWRPYRVSADPASFEAVKSQAARTAASIFDEIESWMRSRPALSAAGPSLLDVYLVPFFRWAWRFGWNIDEAPCWSAWMRGMLEYESVADSLEVEGISAWPQPAARVHAELTNGGIQ